MRRADSNRRPILSSATDLITGCYTRVRARGGHGVRVEGLSGIEHVGRQEGRGHVITPGLAAAANNCDVLQGLVFITVLRETRRRA